MTAPLNDIQTDPTGSATGSTPPLGSPPPSEAKPWTAPDHAPAWARGKSPEEILGISERLYGIVEKFNQQGTVAPVSQPAAAPANFNDDDFVSGAQVRALLQQAAQTVQPQVQQNADQMAQMALGWVKDKQKDVFDKYGPEVQSYLANMPKQSWTVDNLTQVANLVRSNHLDELVTERARQLLAEQLPTMRSNGGAGTGASIPNAGRTLQSDHLPENFRRKAESVGLSEQDLEDFTRTVGMTREQFFQQFDNKKFMTAAVADNKLHTGPR